MTFQEKGRYLINSTLVSQIEKSQEHFYTLNSEVEQILLVYYNLEVEAKTISLFEERTEEELMKSTMKALDPYLTAIDALCIDPIDTENKLCVDHARKMISEKLIHESKYVILVK